MTKNCVLVDDEYLDMVNDVAGRLEEAGMRVDRVPSEIGTLVGRAPRAARSRLEAVKGVNAVRSTRGFRAAPPNAPVQ